MNRLVFACACAAILIGVPPRVQAQIAPVGRPQAPVPAPPRKDNDKDHSQAWQSVLRPAEVAASGIGRSGAREVPPPAVPKGTIPVSEFRFNPSEFRTASTGISELAPAMRESGALLRGGGKGLLAGIGGGLAAIFGALFGRGKKE